MRYRCHRATHSLSQMICVLKRKLETKEHKLALVAVGEIPHSPKIKALKPSNYCGKTCYYIKASNKKAAKSRDLSARSAKREHYQLALLTKSQMKDLWSRGYGRLRVKDGNFYGKLKWKPGCGVCLSAFDAPIVPGTSPCYSPRDGKSPSPGDWCQFHKGTYASQAGEEVACRFDTQVKAKKAAADPLLYCVGDYAKCQNDNDCQNGEGKPHCVSGPCIKNRCMPTQSGVFSAYNKSDEMGQEDCDRVGGTFKGGSCTWYEVECG